MKNADRGGKKEKKLSSNKKTNLSWSRVSCYSGGVSLPLVLVFRNAVSTLFCFCGGNHTMADTDCFIFPARTPLSRLLLLNGRICRTRRAEPARCEHFFAAIIREKILWGRRRRRRGGGRGRGRPTGGIRCRGSGCWLGLWGVGWCKVPDHQCLLMQGM